MASSLRLALVLALALCACPRIVAPPAAVLGAPINVTGVRVVPDRSLYNDAVQPADEVRGFTGDILEVTGNGWDPLVAEVAVNGQPLRRAEGSTSTLLRVEIPDSVTAGFVTVKSLDRVGQPRERFRFRHLGAGHLRSPRFINQLQPSLVITQVRAANPGAYPAGVIAATFGFGSQRSQLGDERFLAEIMTTTGASDIALLEPEVALTLPHSGLPFDLDARTDPDDSSLATVSDDAILLHREALGTRALLPPPGTRWAHTLLTPGEDVNYYYGANPSFYAVAVDRNLDLPDGGTPIDAGQRPHTLYQITDDPYVDEEPLVQALFAGTRPRALGTFPAGFDRTRSGEDPVLVDVTCDAYCEFSSTCTLQFRRARLDYWGAVKGVGVATWRAPAWDDGCGQTCGDLIDCERDPECRGALSCAFDGTCLPAFKCMFGPDVGNDPWCWDTLGCSDAAGCIAQLDCRTGLCGQARACIEDPACRAMFAERQECFEYYTDVSYCDDYYSGCVHNSACASLVQCGDDPSCNAMRECQLNPGCAQAVRQSFRMEAASSCQLDPQCAAGAGCYGAPGGCDATIQCVADVCSSPEPMRMVPIGDQKALLLRDDAAARGPACVVDLAHNRVEALAFSPESVAAVPDENPDDARILWLPRADLGAQQVWSTSLANQSAGAVNIEDSRAPYAALEADPQLRRVYAVPRSGPEIDILDEKGVIKDSVNVLGIPLNVVPIDVLRSDSTDSLLLFLYPGITVMTDATGATRFTQVLTVDATPEVGGTEVGSLYFHEKPGQGLSSLWLTLNKPINPNSPDVRIPSRMVRVNVPRESGDSSAAEVFADLDVSGLVEGGFQDPPRASTAIPVALTDTQVVLLVTAYANEVTDNVCTPAQCRTYYSESLCDDEELEEDLECSFLATVNIGADGKAVANGRDGDGGPTLRTRAQAIAGTCSPAGAVPRVYDAVGKRLYWHAPQACQESNLVPSSRTRILDLNGAAARALTETLPDGSPIIPLPQGGVVGSFDVNGTGAQYELASSGDDAVLHPTGLALSRGVGLAVSPDGRRIYAGGDGAILDIAWEEDPARPDQRLARLQTLIPVVGAPTRIHADLRGERLVYLDDSARLVGLVK